MAQLQDSEKTLKHSNSNLQQEALELRTQLKSLRDSQLRYETERRMYELDTQPAQRFTTSISHAQLPDF